MPLGDLETVARQLALTDVVLPFIGHRRRISMHNIIRLEGDGNYTTFFFRDGTKLMVSLTLKTLASRLSPTVFARSHKKNIVNLLYLQEVCPDHQPFVMSLANGDRVDISRRKATEFMRHVTGFQETMKRLAS